MKPWCQGSEGQDHHLSIFEDWQTDDSTAVDCGVAMADGEEERTMLMQLQKTGWSAEQSEPLQPREKQAVVNGIMRA